MEKNALLIEKTVDFIKEAHRGQVDKAGEPYYKHPLRVMMRLGPEATAAEKIAALLHDVVEDTGVSLATLEQMGYTPEVREIVRLVSENHFPGMTYLQHIEALTALGNVSAMKVKLADVADNLSPSRVAALPEQSMYLVKRYMRAKEILMKALGPGDAASVVWDEIEDSSDN